jgi:hypothetical protein
LVFTVQQVAAKERINFEFEEALKRMEKTYGLTRKPIPWIERVEHNRSTGSVHYEDILVGKLKGGIGLLDMPKLVAHTTLSGPGGIVVRVLDNPLTRPVVAGEFKKTLSAIRDYKEGLVPGYPLKEFPQLRFEPVSEMRYGFERMFRVYP